VFASRKILDACLLDAHVNLDSDVSSSIALSYLAKMYKNEVSMDARIRRLSSRYMVLFKICQEEVHESTNSSLLLESLISEEQSALPPALTVLKQAADDFRYYSLNSGGMEEIVAAVHKYAGSLDVADPEYVRYGDRLGYLSDNIFTSVDIFEQQYYATKDLKDRVRNRVYTLIIMSLMLQYLAHMVPEGRPSVRYGSVVDIWLEKATPYHDVGARIDELFKNRVKQERDKNEHNI
jgi:hypothetical protein